MAHVFRNRFEAGNLFAGLQFWLSPHIENATKELCHDIILKEKGKIVAKDKAGIQIINPAKDKATKSKKQAKNLTCDHNAVLNSVLRRRRVFDEDQL